MEIRIHFSRTAKKTCRLARFAFSDFIFAHWTPWSTPRFQNYLHLLMLLSWTQRLANLKITVSHGQEARKEPRKQESFCCYQINFSTILWDASSGTDCLDVAWLTKACPPPGNKSTRLINQCKNIYRTSLPSATQGQRLLLYQILLIIHLNWRIISSALALVFSLPFKV